MGFIQSICSAKNIPSQERKTLALQAIKHKQNITEIAKTNKVSRNFIYTQKDKAINSIDKEFMQVKKEADVLFYIPVTTKWLFQVILCLILNCRASYRGVIKTFADCFDYSISIGTINNVVTQAILKSKVINEAQDLSFIKQGANDEIFQHNAPILTGVDVRSLYCYLLSKEKHRDEDTWGINLLDLKNQGFNPERVFADNGNGLRAGHKVVFPNTPCHHDNFHITKDLVELRRYFRNRLKTAVSYRIKLENKMDKAKENSSGNKYSRKLFLAKKHEEQMKLLSSNITILISWIEHDVLNKAGSDYDKRIGLYNFILEEFKELAKLHPHRINCICEKLENQRESLLAFVKVLEQKVYLISEKFNCPINTIWEICELQRFNMQNDNYHIKAIPIETKLSNQFDAIEDEIIEALESTERTSSMVENFHSRLKPYFFLRKEIGFGYLELLKFYLNHSVFLRSEKEFRVNKTPAEILRNEPHKHWLELLGFNKFKKAA